MKKRIGLLLLSVILCVCFGAALAEEGLKPGDSGDAVLELNTRLRQLNYTTVRASDQYAAATEAAVSAVQEAYGLKVTGIADEETLNIIYGECYRPLSYGATGEDVKLLQEKLVELGYYTGNITGSYLEGTTAAVQIFQGENSMEITGTADVKTQEKLFSLAIRPTPTPTPVPTATPIPTPSPTPGPYQAFTRKLAYGSTGTDVQKVQQRLMDLGFFTYYKVTTGYYKNTQAAVEAFQAHNGLEVTGAVDEATWNALFNDPSTVDAQSEPKPAYEPTPLPYFFEVDVANQVVKVWKYDKKTEGYTDLDRAFLCATGTTTYPSPLGTFTLSGRRSAHCKFPNWGGGEARWWTKITEEIAFHSVLYSDSGNDATLKVSSLTGLGKRGSHGCIRLTVADAKWIYDHAEAGMQVWIHDDAAADPELRYKIKPGELNTKTMMPNVTPDPPVYTYDGKTAPLTAERSLKVGSEGQDVYWLQMKLKELGFYSGTVTGQYREGTQKAVFAYQRSRGLDSSGTANIRTLETLYNEVREANKTPAPTQTLMPDTQTPQP
ncbi:MAG: peptidoglycan-binding protein [Clostridia bacterium]|nr:peptidoglycan-binding protein [Clostridia bacterium]